MTILSVLINSSTISNANKDDAKLQNKGVLQQTKQLKELKKQNK